MIKYIINDYDLEDYGEDEESEFAVKDFYTWQVKTDEFLRNYSTLALSDMIIHLLDWSRTDEDTERILKALASSIEKMKKNQND
jgi:hypothetical protein